MKTSLLAVVTAQCMVLAVSFYSSMTEVQAQSVPSSVQKEISDEYWDMWRSAFQTYEKGEDAIHQRDYEAALLLFQSALDKFNAIKKNNPEWNKSAVDYRIALAKRKVKTTSNYLQVQDRNRKSNSNNDGADLSQDSVKIQTLRQRLLEAEERITKLSSEVERARLASAQVNRLMADKIQIEKDYNALQVQYQELQKNPLRNFELPDAVKQQLAESEEKLKHLQKQLETAAERNGTLVENNKKLTEDNKTAAEELKNLKARVDALMQTQKKLTEEKMDQLELQKKLTAVEDEKTKLQQTLNAHLQKIKDLEEKAKASAADQQKQQKQLEQLSQTVKEMDLLKEQLKKMQEQLQKAAEKEVQSQAYIKTLDSQNKVFQRTVESLTAKLDALNGKNVADDQKKAEETLKKELEKAKADFNAEIKKRDQNLAELKAKLSDTEAKLKKLQNASSTETDDLIEKLKNLENQKKEDEKKKQNELDNVKEQLKKQQEQLQKEKTEKEDDLKNIREKLSKDAEVKKTPVSETEKDILKEKLSEQKAVAGLSQKIKELESSLNRQNARYEADMKQLTMRFENAEKLRLKLQKENDALKLSQKDSKSNSDQSEKMIAELKEEIRQLQSQQETDAKAAADKLAEVEKFLQEKNAQLQQDAAKIQDGLKNTNQQLTEKAALLQKQLEESQALLKSSENGDWIKQLQNIEKELENKEQQIQNLQRDLRNATATAGDLQTEKVLTAEEENAKLKQQIAGLEQNLTGAIQDKHAAGEEILKLKKDLLTAQALQEQAKIEAADDSKLKALQKQLDESEAQRKLLQAEIQSLSGRLSNSSEQGTQATNQVEQLSRHVQESQDKIRRLEATVAKYASGYEAVVQEKVKEKDQIINDLMKEHSGFLNQMETLKQDLVKSNMRMERYRKIVTDAQDTAEKAIAENRKLRGQFKNLGLDPAALKAVEAIESTQVSKNVIEVLKSDETHTEVVVDTKKYDSLMAQAAAAEKDKKFDDALWLYLQAADVDPKNPAPQIAIAFLHCYYEDFASAGKAYDKALRLGSAKNNELEKLLKR